MSLIPSVMIPQIILAGTAVPLNDTAKFVAKGFCTVYWAKQNLESLLPLSDIKLMGLAHPNFYDSLGVLMIHTTIFIVIPTVVLWRSGKKSG